MDETEDSLRPALMGDDEAQAARPEAARAEDDWRPDLNSVALYGVDPRQPARSARASARNRRLQRIEGVFFGRQGTGRAIAVWLAVAGLCIGLWSLSVA